jgi:hypothetical protein
LLKERVHVPSAGITERPRIHRKTTSIQNLEQNRKAFSGGQNVMSTELMIRANEDTVARSRTQMDTFFAIADKIASVAIDGEHDEDADDISRWLPGDLRLLVATEQLLEIKRALLADQESLNGSAQRNLVEETALNSELRQCYRFIVKYVDCVNLVLHRCFVAIKQRKVCLSGAEAVPGLSLASTSPSLEELEQEHPNEKAQELTETAFVQLFGDERDNSENERNGHLKHIVQYYTSLLLIVRACAQGLESPEDTAMHIREMQRDRKPVAPRNQKIEEDVRLQLATLRSTTVDIAPEEM